MHIRSKTDVGGSNRDRAKMPCPKLRRVYPTRPGAATKGTAGFAPKPQILRRSGAKWAPIVCLFGPQAYLPDMTIHFPFQNTYSALPANFFARVAPTPVASPQLIKLNRPLAVQLGLDPDLLSTAEGA